jgi:hypothetical protein
MAETNGTATAVAQDTSGTATPEASQAPAPATPPALASLWTSDELKGHQGLQKFKSVDDLGKSYVELEKKFGERNQAMAIPKDDSPPEAWQAFWQQLPGYPKEASNYNVAPPELPQEVGGWDPTFVQTFLGDVAHKHGMTTPQVQAVFDFYATYMQAVVQAQRDADSTQINDAYETLRKSWTVNTDQNLLIADEYLRRTFGDADPWWETVITRKDGKSVPLKNIPGFITMAFELGQRHGHDKFVLGDGAGGFLTAEVAQQRLDEQYEKRRKGEITDVELRAAIERYQPVISSRQGTAGR